MTIRVYLLSQVKDVLPIMAFEYQIQEGGTPKSSGTGTFNVDPATARKLLGK
jgi:hypothetical protein